MLAGDRNIPKPQLQKFCGASAIAVYIPALDNAQEFDGVLVFGLEFEADFGVGEADLESAFEFCGGEATGFDPGRGNHIQHHAVVELALDVKL